MSASFRVPALSLLAWVVCSVLVVAVTVIVGYTLYYDFRTLMHEVARPEGARGVTGAVGLPGAKGLQGFTGELGHTGPLGPLGITGLTGPFGFIGATGIHGVTGPTGPTGIGDPTMRGLMGPTGLTGVATTGPPGSRSPMTGSTGVAGPTGSRTTSRLGLTCAGITGGVGSLTSISLSPSSAGTAFPLISSTVVGPFVSLFANSQAGLTVVDTEYTITATLLATLSTTQTGVVNIPMSCQIFLTATDLTPTPYIISSETILVPPEQGQHVWNANMRTVTNYSTGPLIVPVLIGFAAAFQCSAILPGSGTLLVTLATLSVTPVEK